MSQIERMKKKKIANLTTDITAPVRELVEWMDQDGYDRWYQAVLERLEKEIE